MNKKPESGHIAPYTHPAAGWGALKQVAINLVRERIDNNVQNGCITEHAEQSSKLTV